MAQHRDVPQPDAATDPMPSIGRDVSRRRLLQSAAFGSALLAVSACGAKGTGGAAAPSTSGAPSPASQPDRSDTEKVVNWSSWVSYMDLDEKTGKHPTLEDFFAKTGIKVTYTEDINGNDEFYSKVRAQLQQGRDIGRDIVVLTDWMAAQWINRGYALAFKDVDTLMPNKKNLISGLQNVQFDPTRSYTMPWQSGFAGLGFNRTLLKQLTGKTEIKTVAELWDPALKGKVTVLDEMRDTTGVVMSSQGTDITNFTDDQFDKGLAELQTQIDSGQIRQVTGNDYLQALENKDVVAVIGWSGDVLALGDGYGFNIPESGGTLWTDNMLIPAMAAHQTNAEKVINYYYDPAVAAKVAAYVQYVCPVQGAKEASAKVDPKLAANPYVFPTPEILSKVKVFMSLTDAQQTKYSSEFQKLIGN